MDVTCPSQARRGWALSQLSGTASSWQNPSYPTCHSRAGFSIGHNKVFEIKSGCHRFWISSQESQILGDEKFSKAEFWVPYSDHLLCVPIYLRTRNQWVICIILISPPWTISAVEYLQNPNEAPQKKAGRLLGLYSSSIQDTWKWGSWLKDLVCFSEGSRDDLAFSLLL